MATGAATVELRRYSAVPAGRETLLGERDAIGVLFGGADHRSWARFSTAGDQFLPMGGIVFQPQHVPLEVITTGGPMLNLICLFDADFVEKTVGSRQFWSTARLPSGLDLRSGAMEQAVALLRKEMLDPGFASEARVESGLHALLVDLARIIRGGATDEAAGGGELSARQMRLIDEYLESSEGRVPTVSDIARICSLSVRSLQRKMKRRTGAGAATYVARFQLNRAKLLIRQGDIPLKEIAYRAGFSNHSNFTQAFRKSTGMTPSEYRSQSSPRRGTSCPAASGTGSERRDEHPAILAQRQ